MAGDSPARPGGGPLSELVPGTQVAGYLLVEAIGPGGGPAVVFRARDERLGRHVALKLARLEPEAESRFLRGARAVAALEHPNVLPVYDAGTAGGYAYLAMRFVAGGSLAGLVRRQGRLSPRRALALLAPVASALDAAHQAGLVHGDVKPANILVDPRPRASEHPYLSDFDVAASARAVGQLTAPGTFAVSADYASPEQIRGADVDGRADQYSLACVAYLLLTGSAPFGGASPMEVLYAHLYQDPQRLSSVRQSLSGAVDPVLAKALAKAPEDRYESCGAFVAALRAALDLEQRVKWRIDPWPEAEYELGGWDSLQAYTRPASLTPGSEHPDAWTSDSERPGSPGDQGSAPPSDPGSGGGWPPRRFLHGRCQDVVLVGKPFSLIASIVSDGVKVPRTGTALLLPFQGPADVTLVLHAPGLRLLGDQLLTVRVPADGDSDPVRFELLADTEGPRTISVTAWLGGSYLGELLIHVTADQGRTVGTHREYRSEIDPAPAEGAVSLVVRHDPGLNAYRFEFRDEDNPAEVVSQLSFEPRRRIERLVAELDRLAAGRAGYSADQAREYLMNAGADLWRELVPPDLRDQFWERQQRITQLTILTDRDTVPWELLYPRDPGHDDGFLVEQFPVTRAVFGRRPARTLSLSPARFVLPRGSLPEAEAEVAAMRRLLEPAQPAEAVISELTPLLDLIRAGDFGLLHFACHNSFEPDGEAAIRLGDAQFTPTFMTTAEIDRVLARSAPFIFINACRSAGLAPTYNRLDGWASRFLGAGAAAFIGSLWAVSDGTAREFAEELYRHLKDGDTLGEALLAARAGAARQAGDPTWLAYCAYGDPRARLEAS